MQEGMLFHFLKEPGSDLYIEQLSLDISGEIDVELFEKAWNFVIQINEMLRTVYRWENVENPVQIILKEHKLHLKYYDFSRKDIDEKQKWLEKIKVKDRKEKFDMREVPFRVTLCKIEKDRFVLMISNHHILYDGWSNGIILKEFFEIYNELYSSTGFLTPPAKTKFKEFVMWLREQDKSKAAEYWIDYLKGIESGTRFPTKTKKNREEKSLEMFQSIELYHVTLSKKITRQIEEFVKKFKITIASLLYGAWGILLLKYTGKALKLIDMLTVEEKEELLKDFNNTAAVYHRDKTIHELFEEQVHRTPDNTAIVFNNKHLTYEKLNRKANQLAYQLRWEGVKAGTTIGILLDPSIERVVAMIAILKAGGAYLPLDPGLPSNRIVSMLEECQASILIANIGTIGKISFAFLKNLYRKDYAVQVTGIRPQLTNLDDLPIPDRSLVNYDKYMGHIGQAWVKNSLAIFATRGCPYKCAYCHKIWPKKHVVRSAENIFAEIELYYNMGVRRFVIIDDIFNMNVKNSSKFFQLIIENKLKVILFSPNGLRGDILTKDYIDLMVEAGTVSVALALETASPRLQRLIRKNLNLEKFKENLQYLCDKYPWVITELFTMTGFPCRKLAQNSLKLLLLDLSQFFSQDTDRLDIVFDPPLGLMVVMSYLNHRFGDRINGRIAKARVDFDSFGELRRILEGFQPDIIGMRTLTYYRDFFHQTAALIRQWGFDVPIVCGGPYATSNYNSILQDWNIQMVVLGEGEVTLYNNYGPTEVTVDALSRKCFEGEVTLGTPIFNVRCYIFDRHDNLVPVGVAGELCVAGDGVSRGYLNNPEFTAMKFVENPLLPFERLYRTGDSARWVLVNNDNLTIEFLGRIDRQVKIRGYRIELGEIENLLLAHDKVKEVLVLDRTEKNGGDMVGRTGSRSRAYRDK
jgi:acyl-CoA synthetase (AMP-forming)/AMP-acid ligase II